LSTASGKDVFFVCYLTFLMCKNVVDLDGPESVHILGPEEGSPGDTITLECTTADSNPPVDVWWVVDGRAVQVSTKTASKDIQ
jgi:hypothetical protein